MKKSKFTDSQIMAELKKAEAGIAVRYSILYDETDYNYRQPAQTSQAEVLF